MSLSWITYSQCTPTISSSGGAVCNGSTQSVIGVYATFGGGSNFQWYGPNGYIPGATSSSINVSQSGTYYLMATRSFGCPNLASNSVVISAFPSSAISALGSTSLCQGASVTLSVNSPQSGYTYQWLKNGGTIPGPNANGPTYAASETGTYSVLFNNGPCTSNAISVTASPIINTTVSASNLGVLCGSGSVTLTATSGYSYYYWFNAAGSMIYSSSTGTFTTSTPGSYSVQIINQSCYANSSPVTVSVGSNTAPTLNGTFAACTGVAVNYYTEGGKGNYNWSVYGGGTIMGDPTASSIYVIWNGTGTKTISVYYGWCGSPSQPTYKNVTVNQTPAAPDMPTISQNTCGAKTLTRGNPPPGVTWYWQGANPYNQITELASPTYVVSGEQTNTNYYIKARSNNSDCWSGWTPLSVTVSDPPAPAPSAFTYCEWDNMSLSTTVYPPGGSLRWYNESDQLQYTGITYPVNLAFGMHNYHVKSINSSGCEGSAYSVTTANVTSCDDQLNWTESIAYGRDGNGNTVEIGHSKNYFDGFGNLLQTQGKNYTANQVLATQPIYNSFNSPVISTLPAPINSTDFGYRYKFVTNASGQRYSASDFDKKISIQTSPGEVKTPNAVGKTNIGTLGWYYSKNNTLEPLTPITSYPYSRSYTPEGPNPTTSTIAIAGDSYRMGSGHEVSKEKQSLQSTELTHYLALRSQFVPTTNITYSGIIGYKYITTDPDGKKSVSFVDLDDRVLVSAVLTGAIYSNWNYTYYNDIGQVVATVAPNGVDVLDFTPPKFVTLFKYDHLGRLIETTSTDEGTSQFVYSLDGKIRFSQSQVQRNATPKRFSYTNYDFLGRVIESGEYTSNGTNPFIFEPHTTIMASTNSILNIVDMNIPQGSDIETISSSNYSGLSRKIDNIRCGDYTFTKYDSDADLPSGDTYHAKQNHLFGQVSKTQNANAVTWYSYNEFGLLEWTKQSLPDVGYKTIDYIYDFNGNVTQSIYQKKQTDKFYHFFTYDADQRLSEVYTSLDSTTLTLHAKYYYYIHGPLKRIELATNLQGIDYTYTLQGSLKSINHMDANNDPGADGLLGNHANFPQDVFGLSFDYYVNDFDSRGHSPGFIAASGGVINSNYIGTIKSVGWFTPVDKTPSKHAYLFTYDNLNQLQNAQWASVIGISGNYITTPSQSAYKEGIGTIPNDPNGNIRSLVRNSRAGNPVANYTYDYEANSNRLDKVNDSGSVLVDYTYNSIGQMISYVEAGNVINLHYNAYGLVSEILNGSTVIEGFVYDDRGEKIKKINYDNFGTVIKTTYYIHDVSGNVLGIYEKTKSGALALVEVPIYGISRLGEYKPGKTFFYELNDHQGNVRAVIGAPFRETFKATMETENSVIEDKQFKNISPRTTVSTNNPSPNNTPGGNEAIYLNNTRPVGPATILKVSPGDIITINTYAYYEGGTGYSSTAASAVVLNSIINAFGGVSGALGDPGNIFNALNNSLSGGTFAGLAGSADDQVPAAYLNMIMFDGNMLSDPTTLPMSATPVTSAANMQRQRLTIGPLTIPSPGYIYVYVNNNSDSANPVYFDDLTVTQLHSPFVAGGDYYPYGLPMEDRQIKIEPYRFGYQGQYAEKDSVTGWNNFDLRMYEPRFGRWISTDPEGQFASLYVGMGNIPNDAIDIDGGYIYIATENLNAFLRAFNFLYSTPLGRKFINKYLNNPHEHIYIGFGKTRDISSSTSADGVITESHAGGITNSSFYMPGAVPFVKSPFYINGNIDFSLSATKGGYMYFQNFNNTELVDQTVLDKQGFITMREGSFGRSFAGQVGHEIGSHMYYLDPSTHTQFFKGDSKIKMGYGTFYPENSIQDKMYSQIRGASYSKVLSSISITSTMSQLVFRGAMSRGGKVVRTPRFRHQ